ncbi:MAG: glycosyltransferase [Clostridia bacterium]|nr:glycosyltransferase [Clostridia bacterium]
MKVLHVLALNRFSGAENVVCQIIKMFEKDEDIEMAYCSPDGEIREALKERGIPFYPLKNLTKKELKKAIDAFQPDVLHAHDMRASFVAARAKGKRRLISHVHNNAYDSRGISLKSVAYLWAAIRAKHIFWVSDSAYRGYCFHNLFKKKSSVLYNVIDVDATYEKMRTDKREYDYDVVYLGRLSYEKNPQRVLSVLQKVKEKKADVKAAIIGSGDLEDELLKLREEWGLADHLEFLGFQSNPLKILHDAKVMLMTSRWEGTPMCALEAMALGVPIVSTPTDGLKELIQDGENGFLSDDDEVLAERIEEILNDSTLRDRLAMQAVQRAKAINDVQTYGKILKKAYEGVLEEG